MKRKPIDEDSLFKKLGKFESAENMDSKNNCGKAPNQFILRFRNGELFKSYRTHIAAYVKGQLYVNLLYHDISNTTMLYCKRFTGLTAEQRRRGIKEGTIKTFR